MFVTSTRGGGLFGGSFTARGETQKGQGNSEQVWLLSSWLLWGTVGSHQSHLYFISLGRGGKPVGEDSLCKEIRFVKKIRFVFVLILDSNSLGVTLLMRAERRHVVALGFPDI